MYQCILNSCCVQAALAFEKGLSDMMEWIEVQRETLESMPPPDEDANELQRQIEENKVRMMYSFRQCNPSMHPKEVIKTGFSSLFEKNYGGFVIYRTGYDFIHTFTSASQYNTLLSKGWLFKYGTFVFIYYYTCRPLVRR